MSRGANKATNNEVNELKERMLLLEAKVKALEEKNGEFEKKVELLESRIAISENVSERLSLELDRLDQYHRRPNVILKHALLPERETDSAIKGTVVNILEKELSLPGVAEDIDKLHRVGKIKTWWTGKNNKILL